MLIATQRQLMFSANSCRSWERSLNPIGFIPSLLPSIVDGHQSTNPTPTLTDAKRYSAVLTPSHVDGAPLPSREGCGPFLDGLGEGGLMRAQWGRIEN